jgi:Protein of unknown function (DUF3570)
MQLNGDRKVRLVLAAATGALLGGQSVAQAGQWSFDSQLLLYSEPDRVSLFEPVVSARWHRGDDEYWNFKLTVDSLTGASASGAVPAPQPQTFTTPSGKSTYTVGAGQTPLDPSFLDTRFALNIGWERPLSPLWKATLGANVSTEYDYQSAAVSATLARDFNLRNTTVSFGASLGYDIVEPVGGVPLGLASMSPAPTGDDLGPANRVGDAEQKSIYDFMVGVTQVIDQRSLMQINYGFGRSSGYLSDPYKLVSVVDSRPGLGSGEPLAQLYEARPDSRTKQNVYLAYKRGIGRDDVVDVSYRYLWDDWRVRSHTLDLRYRWDFASAGYWQPHVRYYQQSAAEFYTRFLPEAVLDSPVASRSHASADYRLGDMTGVTLGIKYGRPTPRGHEWNCKLEYYMQSGDAPRAPPGALADFDLFPAVDAAMVQFGFTF